MASARPSGDTEGDSDSGSPGEVLGDPVSLVLPLGDGSCGDCGVLPLDDDDGGCGASTL